MQFHTGENAAKTCTKSSKSSRDMSREVHEPSWRTKKTCSKLFEACLLSESSDSREEVAVSYRFKVLEL